MATWKTNAKLLNWYALAAAAIGFADLGVMASLSSMCCGRFTIVRITAIAAIVGFTSAGGTEGISAAIWPSSFGFGACSLFELPS
jgi:hypothetical protein